ncbi:MAG: tRNA (guanosine(37)-N1)-methyltransferase TrmD [Eubacterium sp.]|jgi:tRNA (guanine37-N1)-methyltransferase|nr:tRNA (guanosine(37)-N1)-methyltransferase TrmD [Eubacterium sp.]
MRIDIATLFPAMCGAVLSESVIGRALKAGKAAVVCHDIRDYTKDKHRRVDDKAYGGGTGMVMMPDPVFCCIESICCELPQRPRIIYLTPQGCALTQNLIKELAGEKYLLLLCGHYEGIDQRVIDELKPEEISVGDFVVTGGELPALMLADAVLRLLPGVLPNEEAYINDSHFDGLLEHPLYTRPEEWHGLRVPEVLISGNHANIKRWKYDQSLSVTGRKRPDLIGGS